MECLPSPRPVPLCAIPVPLVSLCRKGLYHKLAWSADLVVCLDVELDLLAGECADSAKRSVSIDGGAWWGEGVLDQHVEGRLK